MKTEIKTGKRTAHVELLENDGRLYKILLDEKEYSIDLVEAKENVYSVLLNGKSYDIFISPNYKEKTFVSQINHTNYNIEIIDQEKKYKQSRKGDSTEGENTIVSPMPGKIIKILCEKGEEVESGQVLIIVEAMKMESELKAKMSGKIKDIKVKETETVDANQTLIMIE